MDENLLDISDVTRRLHVSRTQVYRLIKRGELHVIYLGTRIRIRPEEIRRYLRDMELASPGPASPRRRDSGK